MNDTYLDFGTGLPNAFAWQVRLGGPFTLWIISVFLIPTLMMVGTPLLGGDISTAKQLAVGLFDIGITYGSGCALFGFLILLSTWWSNHIKYKRSSLLASIASAAKFASSQKATPPPSSSPGSPYRPG